MIAGLIARFRPTPVASVVALQQFLVERANLVTQKTIIGYCHARTLLPMNELMRDRGFAEAFNRARCHGYAAVLEDLVTIAESRLRPAAAGAGVMLIDGLTGVFARGLQEIGQDCASELDRPALIAGMQRRLGAARERPAASIADIGQTSAGRVYAAMPIHERLRAPDEASIRASVRFMLVGLGTDYDRRLNPAAIVADFKETAGR